MSRADLSNPNTCLVCEPAVSESDCCDNEPRHLHHIPVDDFLTLAPAEHGPEEKA